MSSQSQMPPEVFVSYSHLDSEYKDHLVKQLEVLAEQKIISQWHDGLLVAGERWNDEIVKRLNSSGVILLLISVDFLTSVYVNNVEIKEASRRYQAGEVTVIPVLVRNVYGWKKKPFGNLKLGDLQALPSSSKFIKGGGDIDAAFADVAEGIQRAVEKLKPHSRGTTAPPPSVPTSHLTDYVKRHDEKGRDILDRLKELLAREKKGPVALWGKGGTGKTRIASEAATALTAEFSERIVWASAEKRIDFTFSTLLDEIARQLGKPEVLKLTQELKDEAVGGLLTQSPTLVVLDNFETVSTADERNSCVSFLAERANCPSLITSRLKVPSPARNIPIRGMSNKEAQELLDQLIEQTQDSGIFSKQVRSRIIKASEASPYIMLWMVAQIDEAQTPKKVLDELEQGKGPVAERVFDRSFTLEQVGEDGRAALLALSLFVPDASREALTVVAGFGGDVLRMDEAAKNLRMLWLIGATEANERLGVAGLTRSLAISRLPKDEHVDNYRQRFVAHFLKYAEAHAQPTPEDYGALATEKDNLLSAMDVAFDLKEWESVQRVADLIAAPYEGMLAVRGYWDEAIKRSKQGLEAARFANDEWGIAQFAGNTGTLQQERGEYDEARKAHNEALTAFRKLESDKNISVALHQLAILAQTQGELDEARRLYNESMELKKKLNDERGIAATLHQLGNLAQDEGNLQEALRLYNESIEIKRRLPSQSRLAVTLHELAHVAQALGDRLEARRLYDESLGINKQLGDQMGIAFSTHALGELAEHEGNKVEARRLFREALAIFERLKSPKADLARRDLERVEGDRT